ncbi:4-alpha-glucanotransferase [Neorhizobium alkalisoli]|uniref:4-alpha-glucanotransferase n=1 Tax=Neorhizobium alkalisoli TaxID=528178 RepID=UPI000CFA1575|nr:4-alpha-glucanotransferase [Neorhizobium alkalisoli]
MTNNQAENEIAIDRLAEKLGIQATYEDLQGVVQEVPRSTRLRLLQALGFHDQVPRGSVENRQTPRLEVPEGTKCYLPDMLQEKRVWGISLQLYELRSSRNHGIGDFEDLKNFCRIAADAGADFIGLNPLHALFLSDPSRCSPYSPSNRLFFNPLYLAVDNVPGFSEDMIDQKMAARLRYSETVDYVGVADVKLAALKTLWQRWKGSDPSNPRFSSSAFRDFKTAGGHDLCGHCLFEAISGQMTEKGYGSGWLDWPQPFRDCQSREVQDFATAYEEDVDFHAWLQWLTTLQIEEVVTYARAVGLGIGLYFDFAVGDVPDGSSTWSRSDLVLRGMHIGAPPDAFSAAGQDWGLVPLSPAQLTDQSTSHYKKLVGASMSFAGALRLDHAMSLWQLFLIPEGETPATGGYMRYPFPEMIQSLAEISQVQQTLIVGEDLGNVPEGFRPAMEKAGILGYRVLYFEDYDDQGFNLEAIPYHSLACLSTHDLSPLAGWWRSDDISLEESLGRIDPQVALQLRSERQKRKRALLQGLVHIGLLPSDMVIPTDDEAIAPEIAVGLHRLLARVSSMLVTARLSDLIGESLATNIPGTSSEYPNWQLKLKVLVEDLPANPVYRTISAALSEERPKPHRWLGPHSLSGGADQA